MAQHPRVRSDIREGIDRTAHAVATGNEAYLTSALDSVSWERRGLLGRLTRRPRSGQSEETAA
jgi:hypothetical protein